MDTILDWISATINYVPPDSRLTLATGSRGAARGIGRGHRGKLFGDRRRGYLGLCCIASIFRGDSAGLHGCSARSCCSAPRFTLAKCSRSGIQCTGFRDWSKPAAHFSPL